jgi:hypothetical protein
MKRLDHGPDVTGAASYAAGLAHGGSNIPRSQKQLSAEQNTENPLLAVTV